MTVTTFLLSDRIGWDFFQHEDGSFYPQIADCKVSVVCAVVLLCARICCERFLLKPLASKMGVFPPPSKVLRESSELEEIYKQWGLHATYERLRGVAKCMDMTVHEVKTWLRDRQAMDCPSRVVKFTECGWHVIYYSLSFSCTLYYVWEEPWLWTSKEMWRDWPKQSILPGVYWAYMIQMGHYISLLFSIIFLKYHRKKDTLQMSFHHCITIALMAVSWSINTARVGILVLLTHDIADPGLNLAKMLWESKKKKPAEKVLFVTFGIWVVSRLIFYPITIIKSSLFDCLEVSVVGLDMGMYWITNVLLLLLLMLHINWTLMFLRLIRQKFAHGEVKKDEFDRSSGSESSDGEAQDKHDDKKSK